MLTGPCGLSRGDHVIVLLPKLPHWWLLNIACAGAGIIIIFFVGGIILIILLLFSFGACQESRGIWEK